MNKTIALLILGVILLAMALVMLNQYVTGTPPPPRAGMESPMPQTGGLMPVPQPVEQEDADAPRPLTGDASTFMEPKHAVPAPQTPPPASSAPTPPTPSMTATPAPVPAPLVREPAPVPQVPVQTAPPKDPAPVPPARTPAPEERTPAAPSKPAAPKVVSSIVVYATQEGATVRVVGAVPLVYKTLHLKNPDRAVVDLDGPWTVKAPGVPANKVVNTVRIGKQAKGTRIVIDLKGAPEAVNFIKKDARTLDVRVR